MKGCFSSHGTANSRKVFWSAGVPVPMNSVSQIGFLSSADAFDRYEVKYAVFDVDSYQWS